MVLEEMSDIRTGKSLEMSKDEMVVSDTPQVITDETPRTIVPCHSGRIIKAPDRFIFLGEPYEAISKRPESNLKTYEEAINDVETDRWVKAMEVGLESMYSNQV